MDVRNTHQSGRNLFGINGMERKKKCTYATVTLVVGGTENPHLDMYLHSFITL